MHLVRVYGLPFLSAVVGAVGVTTLTPEAFWHVDQSWEYLAVWASAVVFALIWITYKQHCQIVWLGIQPDIDRHWEPLVDVELAYRSVHTQEEYESWERSAGAAIHEVTHRFRESLPERLPTRFAKKWTAALTSEAIERRSIGPVESGFNSEAQFAHRVRQTVDALNQLSDELSDRPSWRSALGR